MLNVSSIFSVICVSPLENSLWRYVCNFFYRLVFLMSTFLCSLYILYIGSQSDMELVNNFSHSVGCHFV